MLSWKWNVRLGQKTSQDIGSNIYLIARARKGRKEGRKVEGREGRTEGTKGKDWKGKEDRKKGNGGNGKKGWEEKKEGRKRKGGRK